MKFTIPILLLAGVTVANPVALIQRDEPIVDVEKRATGITSKEFTLGGCRDIIFIFARGSTEVGNMGASVGPVLSDGIKAKFGEGAVATEGVDYAAALATNFNPGGADYLGIAEMKRLINLAASRCPNAKIVVSGYSQGAALTHRAVEDLPSNIKDRIAAAVTFGDTQNLQDRGRIPNFDTSKTLIICNTGDAVCRGTLTILPAHLDYVRRVPEAVSFVSQHAS